MLFRTKSQRSHFITNYLKTNYLTFVTLIALFFTSSLVNASLVLNPQRIVFQDREKSASLDLLNTSEETGRYQIYFEHKIMKEDGSIVDIEDPDSGGPYAGDMIRYSPRRVDIAPGGSQTIRLALRRPKSLEDGEYLSHLVLKQIPNKREVQANTEDNATQDQLNLTVQPILKLAIPVIVRKGSSSTTANISNIEAIYKDKKVSNVHFTLHRQGNFSLYGDVELFELVDNTPQNRIGFIRGIALYDPTPQRLVRITLAEPQDLTGKKLLLKFTENEKYGGTNIIEKIVDF